MWNSPSWTNKFDTTVTIGTHNGVPANIRLPVVGVLLECVAEQDLQRGGVRYTFAHAGWYLREECDKGIHGKLTRDRYWGFRPYVEECLRAGEVEPDRLEMWCKTVDALIPAGIPHPEQCSAK
ncbi:hypothetical protein C7212DRAFT_366373 [Tuber magnatum]|uniref:Uncharacterized protein n=1 Tax=Tuber magnatum TaxID=42249 RepID=A0A317SHL2_9PEZI|nr:hypothetical protein C7212DRAFT_366373 [Tuber magnatum]